MMMPPGVAEGGGGRAQRAEDGGEWEGMWVCGCVCGCVNMC